MKEFKFDPKIFISPPYIECPKCQNKNSFGVLSVQDQHYIRRCKECWHTANFNLPKLNKKVVYLDQFVISNMMKSLNPDTKAFKKKAVDKFWAGLFNKLYRLANMQLIICPDSEFHTEESLVSPYFHELKRMYELLGHGLSFYDRETIRNFQICERATNWIKHEKTPATKIAPNSIIHGNKDAWCDRLYISMNTLYDDEHINDLRKWRSKTHSGILSVFRAWQKEKGRSFNDWYEEEVSAYGRTILRIYFTHLKKWDEIFNGKIQMTVNDILGPPAVTTIHALNSVFQEYNVPQEEVLSRTIEFLISPMMKEVPFNKISSMLYAAMARKAAGGRKKPPGQGIVNDIPLISVLLPYCDAMFLDKECYGYLNEEPLKSEIDYNKRLFSLTNREEFMDYLDAIEKSAPKMHISKVTEVYGDSWLTPYTTLYQKQSKK